MLPPLRLAPRTTLEAGCSATFGASGDDTNSPVRNRGATRGGLDERRRNGSSPVSRQRSKSSRPAACRDPELGADARGPRDDRAHLRGPRPSLVEVEGRPSLPARMRCSPLQPALRQPEGRLEKDAYGLVAPSRTRRLSQESRVCRSPGARRILIDVARLVRDGALDEPCGLGRLSFRR